MDPSEMMYEKMQFFYNFVIVNGIQLAMEFYFFNRFLDRKCKVRILIPYMLLSFLINAAEVKMQPAPLSILLLAIRIIILSVFGLCLLRCGLYESLSAAIITKTSALLSAGISSTILFLAMPVMLEANQQVWRLYIYGFLVAAFTLVLIAAAYLLILRKFKWQGTFPGKFFTVLLLPVLLVITVEQFIFNQVYGNEVIINGHNIVKPFADHWQILLIQSIACLSLFSTLYACRKLSGEFQSRTRAALLEQEVTAQRDYVEEARSRYEQARSFRHDIKGHLLVINGLLEQGGIQEAREYLDKLEKISDTLSYPCNTGNTVVDVLLNSKLSAAGQSGIKVECTVKIPASSCADSLDLCILFSNAVDNAVHACRLKRTGERFLRISGKLKGDFFMLEVENSCNYAEGYKKGVGLSNIEMVAEKYHGAVSANQQGNCFRLNVLLVISRSLNDI